MGLNFPASPAINDLYPVPAVPGVPQYKWDGTVWLANAGGGGAAGGDFVPIAGGVMTGPLYITSESYIPFDVNNITGMELYVYGPGGVFELDRYDNDPNASANFILNRARGTLDGGSVPLQLNDWIGWLGFGGEASPVVDGVYDWPQSAGVGAIVDSAPSANSLPTALSFYTGASAGGIERLRIGSSGKVKLTNPVAIVDADQVPTKLYVDSKAPVAATVAEYRSNSAPTKMLTPGTAWGAMTSVDLSGTEVAGVLTIDFNSGFDFFWYISAAGRTLANPTGLKTGQRGTITLSNTGAGTITTWGSKWKFPGGVKPTLTPNAVDLLSYFVADPAANIYCTVGTDFK